MSIKLRFAFIGDTFGGKSHISNLIVNNFLLCDNVQKTIGFDYFVRYYDLNNKKYQITFYDFSGDDKYQSMIDSKNYYSIMDGIFIVFDITNLRHINNLFSWIKKVSRFNKYIYILGNKSDMESKYIFYAKSLIYELAKYHIIHNYIMISVNEPESIKYCFNSMINHVIYSQQPLIEPIINCDNNITNNDTSNDNKTIQKDTLFDILTTPSKILSFFKKK